MTEKWQGTVTPFEIEEDEEPLSIRPYPETGCIALLTTKVFTSQPSQRLENSSSI